MSLYRRGNVWWSRIEVNKHPHQFSCKTSNKNTARAVEAQERTRLLKHATGLSSLTLSEFNKQFFNDGIFGRVAKTSVRYYVCYWQTLEQSPLGTVRLDRIGTAEVDQFITWRRKKNVAVTTINHSLRVLRRALRLAAEWKLLARPPKIKLLKGEHEREYVLSDATVQLFAAEKGVIGKVVPFLVDTGLRRRELCGLQWPHVNLDEKWIQITKSKSKAGRRRIPLTARAVKILTGLPHDSDFVFTNEKRPITLDWISHEFLRAKRRINAAKDGEKPEDVKRRALPDDCVLHSCRHTAATRAGKAGASPFALQKLFGWSSIQMAMRYCHPDQEQLESVIARL